MREVGVVGEWPEERRVSGQHNRAAAVYLASEESWFLTSQVRNVNGRQPRP